jgi:hypothetical protein
MALPETSNPKGSAKKPTLGPRPTASQQSQVDTVWMGRDDALDLLVRTACTMPWSETSRSTNGLTAHLDADELPGADATDPLLLQADTAIALISRCEELLARRRAEHEDQAKRLTGAQSAISSQYAAEQHFETGLIGMIGKPMRESGRFSYAQIRRFLTGHEAAKRGDDRLKEIWLEAKELNCAPKRFDPVTDKDFRDAVDGYVHSEGLASWQLRILAP